MSDSWNLFDKPSPQEKRDDELKTDIDASLKRVLEEVERIAKIIRANPSVRHVGMSTLGHVSFMARQTANKLGREDLGQFADAAIGRKKVTTL